MLTSHEMSVKSPNAVQCMLNATSKDIAAVLFSDAYRRFCPLSKIDHIGGYYAGMRGSENLSGSGLIALSEVEIAVFF